MTTWADVNIHHAMRIVSQSIMLDTKNKSKEAYTKYLESIEYIVQTLLKDSAADSQVGNNSQKLIKLGQQCMERLGNILQSDGSQEEDIGQPPRSLPSSLSLDTHRARIPQKQRSDPGYNSLPVISSPGSKPKTPVLYPRTMISSGPMELAQRQNQQMIMAYQARIKSLDKSKSTNLSLTLHRKLAENIAVAKKREEALAKKMQERQKMLEAEVVRRFESSVGMSKDEQERRLVYTKIIEFEHNKRWLLAWRDKLKQSPENSQLIQDLVKTVLHENDHPLTQILCKFQNKLFNKLYPLIANYLMELKDIVVPYPDAMKETTIEETADSLENKSEENSYSISVPPDSSCDNKIEDTCKEVKQDTEAALIKNEAAQAELRSNLHISQEVYDIDTMDDLFDTEEGNDTVVINKGKIDQSELHAKMAEKLAEAHIDRDTNDKIQEMTQEAFERHVPYLSQDVKAYLDKTIGMFVVAYADLDNPTGKEQCYSCVEEHFFTPLWPYVQALFRLANRNKEISLAKVMTKFQTSSAMELKVNPEFLPDPSLPLSHKYPYEPAVTELHRLVHAMCPLDKLESVVTTSKLVCHCVEVYAAKEASVGADDLIPILCFVILKSGLPQLVSECNAMEEFIHEGYLLGEEGYCLTSLQTAIGYVLTLENKSEIED